MSAEYYADHDILDIPDDPDLHLTWIKHGYGIGSLTPYQNYLEELYRKGLLLPAFSYARYMPPEAKAIYQTLGYHMHLLPLAIRVPDSRVHITSTELGTGKWGEEGPHFSSNIPWIGVGTLQEPLPTFTKGVVDKLVHLLELRHYFLFILAGFTDGGQEMLLPMRTWQVCLLSMDYNDPVLYLRQNPDSAWRLHNELRLKGLPFLADVHLNTYRLKEFVRNFSLMPTSPKGMSLPPDYIRELVKKPLFPAPPYRVNTSTSCARLFLENKDPLF